MKIILVSHPSRAHHVAKLQDKLPIMATVVDTVSAKSGHRAALRIASQVDERVAIMEDDAIPVERFDEMSDWWAMCWPDELISFYLGTSRPKQFQPMIDQLIATADKTNESLIWLPMLIHAVCYSIPRHALAEVIAGVDNLGPIKAADYAIGAAWGRPVCYPIESLVQHRDETPVERHPDGEKRIETRVARRLAGSLMFNP